MILEAQTFSITLPEGWVVVEQQHGQLSAAGPTGDVLRITAASVNGAGTDAERRAVLERLRARALRAIERSAIDAGKTAGGAKTRVLSDGMSLDEFHSQSTEHQLLQAVVTGDRGVLLVSYEGQAAAMHEADHYSQIVESIKQLP